MSLAHLFGGLLLANATASKALADVLRGKVTLEELRRGYLDYLRAGEEITYRQFLEPSDDPPPPETPPPDTPAALPFVRVRGAGPEGGGLVLDRATSDVVTATLVTGTGGDENPITVKFAPDADWLPAEVVAQTASLTLLRLPGPQPLAARASLSRPEPGMDVTYEGADGTDVEAAIADVAADRIELISTVPALPGAPICEAATGAVVGIAENPTSMLSAAVLSRARSARRRTRHARRRR